MEKAMVLYISFNTLVGLTFKAMECRMSLSSWSLAGLGASPLGGASSRDATPHSSHAKLTLLKPGRGQK